MTSNYVIPIMASNSTLNCDVREGRLGESVAFVLILGSILSYVPQYYKIIKHRNVEGISHWTLGLNNMTNFGSFFGAFILDYYLFKCCHLYGHCFEYVTPFIQLLFVWLCPLVNYIIFIVYFRGFDRKERFEVYGFFAFYVVIFLVCFTLTSIVLLFNWYQWKKHAIFFGDSLNIFSVLLTSFVWIPQMITTFKTNNVGSLSLISLAIQAPGSLTIFIYQVIINKASWFIGIPYLATSVCQSIVLAIGYFIERRRLRFSQNKVYNLYDDIADDSDWDNDHLAGYYDIDSDSEWHTEQPQRKQSTQNKPLATSYHSIN